MRKRGKLVANFKKMYIIYLKLTAIRTIPVITVTTEQQITAAHKDILYIRKHIN